jgi:hypothetical protein
MSGRAPSIRRARGACGKRWPALVVAAALPLLAVSPAAAQAPKQVVPFEGTQVFRQILSYADLKPLAGPAELAKIDPKETIVIILGVLGADPLDGVDRLEPFVKKGGAVLVASEQGDPAALTDFGIALYHNRIRDKVFNYANNRECPLVLTEGAPEHPAFKDVAMGIATNRPTHLSSARLPVLASFSHFAGDQNEIHRGWTYAFAAGTPDPSPGAGRILVLAGYGQFTNGMMLRLDNDNFTFAWNVVRWLRESEGGGKRKYALLLEDGRPVDTFEGPLTISLPQVSLANLLNRWIDRLEREDFLNQLLARVPREWLLRGVLIFATVLLVFFGRRWLVRARHRLESEAPLVDLTVEGMLAELPPLSRRHRAMLVSGNFYDAARALARGFFERHLGHDGHGHAGHGQDALGSGPAPAIDVSSVWSGSGMHHDVEWLWELAYGAAPMRVSSTRLAEVVRTCHNLDAALADGTLLFHPPPARKMVPLLAQTSKLE